jgi:lipopolysaccharide transport system ATP-binding protein
LFSRGDGGRIGMSEVLLSVSGLSKKYSRRLGPFLARRSEALRKDEFWALDDVSFVLRRGESLGILGHNGAGKSTLLKLLCGLLKPDRGEIRIQGRTEALIELGTAFNGLLTGRENVLMAAAIHGFDRRRTGDLVDEAVAFAELEDFIDVPFQSYSTGMKARLAYAVAARFEPDLLLVDEVLAVGDAAFQYKCLNHMKSYLAAGGSLLFVSHNLTQVMSVCERGLLLSHGRQIFEGPAMSALRHLLESRLAATPAQAATTTASAGDAAPMAVGSVVCENVDGGPLRSGQGARLVVTYDCAAAVEIEWGFSIWTRDQSICVAAEFGRAPVRLAPGAGTLACTVPSLPVAGGQYLLRARMTEVGTGIPLGLWGWESPVALIDVDESGKGISGPRSAIDPLVRLDVDWG